MDKGNKSSIFRQLVINIIIPVILGLFVLAIINYQNLKDNIQKSNAEKNQILIKKIKQIIEFQDLALEIHEDQLDERMRIISRNLINNVFNNTDNIEEIDLNKLRDKLGMDNKHEDIYIINKEGIVVNTTFEKDLNLDFFSFGTEHKKYLEDIFVGGVFVSERFTIESRTKRLRKYSYQPTKNKKYIIEIGFYSEKADEIIKYIRDNLLNLSYDYSSIKSVDLYIFADDPFTIGKDVSFTQEQRNILNEVYETKVPQNIMVKNELGKCIHNYIYLDIRNTDLYKGAVIRIISDREAELKYLQLELFKILLIFGIIIITIIALIYKKSKGITRPILNLVENIQRISSGNYEERAKVEGNNEVTELSNQFNIMIDNIQTRNKEASEQREEIEAQKQQLLKANNDLEKLSLVASKTNNAVSIYNNNGKLEWFNNGYHQLYGYTFNEVIYNIGDSIFEINTNPDIKNLFNICVKTKQPVDFETKAYKKSGKKIWIQTTMSPIIDEKNKISGIIAIDSNITTLKDVEKKIKQKNKDITDSIYYAKKIQEAILPNFDNIELKFDDLFVLLKPKSIVSGDFFWYTLNKDQIVVAAADCTGHGIPGAFMSIIGNSFLHKIINENNILNPGKILYTLRDNIHNLLNKNDKNVISRDGIDIALCSFSYNDFNLKFAGSFNPLYIVTKNERDIEKDSIKSKIFAKSRYLYEIKANRFPIVTLNSNQKFDTRTIKLNKGDRFYLFTDGFADQFGGHEDKKYKYNNFKKLILKIQNKTFIEQKRLLSIEYEDWKGKNDQVDDLLVVGVQV